MRTLSTSLLAAVVGAAALLAPPAGAGTRAAAVDEVCPNGRVALTFDDGVSAFRPQTLQILRDRLVPATFFDIGMRVAANPHVSRFAVEEGHTVFNHTYRHDDLGTVSAVDVRYELLATEHVFEQAGVEMPFKGMREPRGSGNETSRAVIDGLGYLRIGADAGGFDFVPSTPAIVIREAILNNLAPGRILLMHDGPADTTAGETVLEALPQVIDGVRERGYCFGSLDSNGQVVPDRLEPSDQPVPEILDPVPYRPLEFEGIPPYAPPQPYAVVSGLSVRYLSVEIDDLRVEGTLTRRLAEELDALVGTAEAAQIRGLVARQRAGLAEIAETVRVAPDGQLSSDARQRLLALTERMASSIEDRP